MVVTKPEEIKEKKKKKQVGSEWNNGCKLVYVGFPELIQNEKINKLVEENKSNQVINKKRYREEEIETNLHKNDIKNKISIENTEEKLK